MNAPADADGNFIIGPTHNRAPEMIVNTNVPQGTVYEFTMNSADSKIYPGVAREPHTFGTIDPAIKTHPNFTRTCKDSGRKRRHDAEHQENIRWS